MDSISDLKKKYINMLIESEAIVNLIDDKNIKFNDELLGTHIFPVLKIDYTIQDVGTYICLQIKTPGLSSNDVYKDITVTFTIISNNQHIITSRGTSRVDELSDEILKIFNHNDRVGFVLDLKSDTEDPLTESFYYRRLILSTITSNTMENGNTLYDWFSWFTL